MTAGISTIRKGNTIGVNRDGKPIGVIHRISETLYTAHPYLRECPWDCTIAGLPSEAEALRNVEHYGATPDYMEQSA